MNTGELGRHYSDGEIIVREGEEGHVMFVIQEGMVEVFVERGGREVILDTNGPGAFFGEMAIFERDVRSASVRAKGDARILTIDKKNFMRRIHEDPSLAFRIVETLSRRVRTLSGEVARLKSGCEE